MTTRRRGAGAPSTQTPANQPAQSGGGTSWMKRGDSIMQTAAEVQAEAERKRSTAGAYRFWLPNDSKPVPGSQTRDNPQGIPSNEAEVIILDASINDAVAFHEHTFEVGAKKWVEEPCCKELENCPLCERHGDSYYVMMLTVLDLRGYDRKDDQGRVIEHVAQSRKLLPIKSSQMTVFRQIEQACIKKHGTFRGCYMVLQRDTRNSQSPRIGAPIILDSGAMFDFVPEAELEQYANEEFKGRDGKVLKQAGEDIEPFNYEELFPKPDANDIRRRYRIAPPAGNPSQAAAEFGEQAPANPVPGPGGSRRRPSAAAPQEAPQEQAPQQEAPQQPAGRSRRGGGTPPPPQQPTGRSRRGGGGEPFAPDAN